MATYQYKVKKTDTLPKLAEQYRTTPAAILQQNQIANLSPGTVIKLPQYNTQRAPQNVPPVPTSGPFPISTNPNLQAMSGPFPVSNNPLFQTTPINPATIPTYVNPNAGANSFVSGAGTVNTASAPPQNNNAPVFPGFGGFRNPNGGPDLFFRTLREARIYQRRKNGRGDTGTTLPTTTDTQTYAVNWRVGG